MRAGEVTAALRLSGYPKGGWEGPGRSAASQKNWAMLLSKNFSHLSGDEAKKANEGWIFPKVSNLCRSTFKSRQMAKHDAACLLYHSYSHDTWETGEAVQHTIGSKLDKGYSWHFSVSTTVEPLAGRGGGKTRTTNPKLFHRSAEPPKNNRQVQ